MTDATLEDCYRYADDHEGESPSVDEARLLLIFAASTAADYRRKLSKLAWACKESNSRKRNNVLQVVLAELSNSGESTADLPMREYAS